MDLVAKNIRSLQRRTLPWFHTSSPITPARLWSIFGHLGMCCRVLKGNATFVHKKLERRIQKHYVSFKYIRSPYGTAASRFQKVYDMICGLGKKLGNDALEDGEVRLMIIRFSQSGRITHSWRRVIVHLRALTMRLAAAREQRSMRKAMEVENASWWYRDRYWLKAAVDAC